MEILSKQNHKSFSNFSGGGIFNSKIPLIFLCMLMLAIPAFAEHTATVTIDPDMTNCDSLGNTFTVNVANDVGSTDEILQVEIYKALAGISDFDCGLAPAGWTLFSYEDRCIYVTGLSNPAKISPTENLDFTFDAVMSSDACASEFIAVTIDDAYPTGDRDTVNLPVSIDCTAPIITKEVGTPKILIDVAGCNEGPFQGLNNEACGWWITQNTTISTSATENEECDLGLDYCEVTYTVDGGEEQTAIYETFEPETFDWSDEFGFDEDSVHVISIECTDVVGNKTVVTETDRVDTTPPETTKTYGLPSFPANINDPAPYPHWITTSTPITLDRVDGGEICAIDNGETRYYDIVLENNEACENEELCQPDDCWHGWITPKEGEEQADCIPCEWQEYTGPFTKQEESCHLLVFQSRDALGNVEEPKYQCVYVEDQAPTGDIIVGDPNLVCEKGTDCDWWVRDHVTEVTMTCTDGEPHPVNNNEVCYQISYDVSPFDLTAAYCNGYMEKGYCCEDADKTIIFEEDSRHGLNYFCRDALGNTSDEYIYFFRVDSQPPIIVKTMTGPQVGDCPPGEGDECWIMDWEGKEGTTISINAVDDPTYDCAVDQVTCDWHYLLDGEPMRGGYELEAPFDIKFYDETQHELYVECCDALGNCAEDIETFYVDSSGPTVEKTISEPKKVIKTEGGTVEWIDTVTEITITSNDLPDAPCAVGNETIYYVITPQDDEVCWNPDELCREGQYMEGAFQEYTGPISDIDESCHRIEFFAVDELGNIGEHEVNCFFVDKTAPEVYKDNGNALPDSGDQDFMTQENPDGDFHWITQYMPITMWCEDQQPHPSGDEELCFKVSYDYPDWGYITEDYCEGELNAEGYCCVSAIEQEPLEFYFQEDSKHNLEYYCQDAVEKKSAVHVQYYKVDTEGPEIIKTLNEPYYGQCPPRPQSEDICYVDTATTIDVEAVDGGDICAVDDVYCHWTYRVIPDCLTNPTVEITQITPVWREDFPITFPEESCHSLVVECWDALGNTATDVEMFIVDKTPPVITKDYSGPFFTEDGKEWINSLTDIYAGAYDPEPHPSGVQEVKYRVSLVADEFCANQDICQEAEGTGDWTVLDEYNNPFNINEESCHLIEIEAKDNVDKTALHKQCVFVENTPPTPVKTVGEPKDLWTPGLNGDPVSFFYPEANEHCWDQTEDSIDCWEVTTLTPISMDCIDGEPHPVDHETVCFNVELDGDDWTQEYCSEYQGILTPSELHEKDFCCLEYELNQFMFKEDSEHELEYYCVDALGNTNEADLDIEKFKVDGTKFDIPLFKKWNLISVPFVLLNDSPEEVFKDTNGVDSVWAYDPSNEICADEWCVFTPDGIANDNLGDITPGWGYWVFEKLDEEWLTLGGSLFSPQTTPPSRNLVPGWNLIGYYGSSWELYEWGDFDFVCGDAFNFPDRYIYGDKVYCSLNSLVDTQEGYPKWSSLWSYINCGNHNAQWLGLNACADDSPQACMDRMYAGRGYWVEMDVLDSYAPATTCIWNSDFECRWTGGGIMP